MDRINKGTINVSDRTALKEESVSPRTKRSLYGITSEPIFNRKKKTTAIPQDTTRIERKIKQLKTQGRNYIVLQDNKSADISNTSIQSSTDILSEDTSGILQYLSKGDLINFNGKAKRNLYDQELITCRHLAYAFTTDEFGTKETGKFSSIDEVGKIARHEGIKTDQELNDSFLYKTAQEGYYFDRGSIGQAIYAACLQQKATHEQTKAYLFHSLNHDMALKINWSPKQPEIKLTFYDPNDTLRVRRLIVSDLQTLKTIKVEDLIPKFDCIKLYYPEDSFGGSLTTTVVKSPEGNSLIWMSSDINSSILHSMLTLGHFSPKIAEQVKEQLEKWDPESQTDLLMAKSKNGYPGLFMALQNGHEACVETYCNLVMNSNIFSNEEKLTLLMAKSEEGLPGLFMALVQGHEACVKTYCDLVMDSNIFSHKEKLALLMTKSDNGFSGFFMALLQGHEACIDTYCKLVMDSNVFSTEEKLALLMAKFDIEVSGLFMALKNGHKACVDTYCHWVIDNNIFSNEEKLALLMAKSDDGVPGLLMALLQGHEACVKIYYKLVIDSNIFSNENKRTLLIAKSDDGFSGLFMALLQGHEACVKIYCELVIDSNIFSNEEKLALLMAKSDTGFSGLFNALQNGHESCVKIYCELVMDSNIFSSEEKLALLMAKSDDGVPGLLMALLQGHDACVKIYCKLVIDSNIFSNENKRTLLIAKSDDGFSGLYLALQNDHEACVKTYCKLVIDSNIFSNEEKLALLMAKSDD